MIDPRILNILKSNQLDPSYSILINSFYQPEFCNKDELQIVVQQVNPNVFDIIDKKDIIITSLKTLLEENDIPIPDLNDLSINNITRKTLTIDSILNYDNSSNMFTSGLIGNISAESNENIPSQQLQGEILNKRIKFSTKDYPNVLANNNQFLIQTNQIIIDIPNNITAIDVKVSHDNLTASYNEYNIIIPFKPLHFNEIINNKIVIDIEDIRQALIPQNIIEDLENNINTITEEIEEKELFLSGNDEEDDDILSEISALKSERNMYTHRKNAIINKIGALTFTSTKPFEFDIRYTYQNDIISTVECINFELTSEININFLNVYKSIPGVVLTIDKQDKMYSSYDTVFTTNQDGDYTGVKLIFNNLKKIRQPIKVNAIIIGDKVV